MKETQYQAKMDAAIANYQQAHDGLVPKVIMLGDDVWRERADKIAEDMNRTGPDSAVVVHRLPVGVQGIVCV